MSFFCIHCRSEIDPRYKACPHCGEAVTDFLRKYLETPIDGKYQILSRLGVGGMGEVYKALHIHLNAIRVIKMMRANIAGDQGAHDRFLREARLATRISHPNVAALYDFSTLDDTARYMVWEYIEGINLHELIAQRGPLSPRYAARIAIQALLGLDAVHRAGIVHRDVSPENIMIARSEDGDERVKIIDLGIAKQGSGDDDNKTKTGMFVGKWKYCSPEHLGMLNEGERIDGRADLYSFGIVVYEMLTGVPPFQADTPHKYLMLHASERPRALRDVNPSTTASPDLEALIFKAMEKDRTKRFATARDFAKALEELLPVLDDTPGAPAPLPVAAEVTYEPTRAARMEDEVATIVTTSGPAGAETVKTMSGGRTPVDAELAKPPITDAAPVNRKPMLKWLGAAVVAIAVAGGAAMWNRHEADASATVPAVASQSLVVPVAQGHVGINAYPWGEVTSIRNLETGEPVELKAPLVTPAPIDLPPGSYEITLSNPHFRQPQTAKVEVKAGADEQVDAHFVDPNRADLPHFDGSAQ
ncbi:MAG TPA: serine/threonine-protein kinase [Thermoanaerobaculia bacterium]|nr:serine/threonine-protein kinase [Thermoanaerobaculia bacterium]